MDDNAIGQPPPRPRARQSTTSPPFLSEGGRAMITMRGGDIAGESEANGTPRPQSSFFCQRDRKTQTDERSAAALEMRPRKAKVQDWEATDESPREDHTRHAQQGKASTSTTTNEKKRTMTGDRIKFRNPEHLSGNDECIHACNA